MIAVFANKLFIFYTFVIVDNCTNSVISNIGGTNFLMTL